MTETMTYAEVQGEVSRAEFLVAQMATAGFEDDILDMAQAELSELKAVTAALLAHGAHALPGLARENDPVWRTFLTKLKRAKAFLEPLA